MSFLTSFIKNIWGNGKRFFFHYKVIIFENKTTILLFTSGVLLISWILFARFRTREIIELPADFNINSVIFYTTLAVVYSIVFCIQIYSLLKKKKATATWVLWLAEKVKQLIALYYLAMTTVHLQIMNRIMELYNKFMNKLRDYFLDSEKYHFWIHLIFVVLFPMIPAIFLTIDVFYFYKLDWFYKSLILVLGPLICRVFLYLFEDFSRPNMAEILKLITITPFKVDGKDLLKISGPAYLSKEDLDDLEDSYFSYAQIWIAVENFRNLSLTWYFTMCQLIQYGLYALSWGYLAYVQLKLMRFYLLLLVAINIVILLKVVVIFIVTIYHLYLYKKRKNN